MMKIILEGEMAEVSLKKIAKEIGSVGEIAQLDLSNEQKKVVRRLYRVLHRKG